MRVTVWVDPAAAVKAGKVTSGAQTVEITEEFLASLTPAEREVLADNLCRTDREALGGTSGYAYYTKDPQVSEATLDTLRFLLAGRVARTAERARQDAEERAKREAAERQQAAKDAAFRANVLASTGEERERYLFDLNREGFLRPNPYRLVKEWPAEFEAEAKALVHARMAAAEEEARRNAERQAAQERETAEALAAWVQANGDENKQARHREGLLPREELLAALREELFAGLAQFQRYERLRVSDLPHTGECNDIGGYTGTGPKVDYCTDDATELSAEEYDLLRRIRQAAPEGAEVTPRVHTGTCRDCDATISRPSALVSLEWHHLPLSREYALDAPESGWADA